MSSPGVTVPHGRPAWSRAARIGDYDGAIDKEDTRTETTPYAWIAYLEIGSALGTAFADQSNQSQRSGDVHSRKLAVARLIAATQRGAEKINANAVPVTADDFLGEWVSLLALRLRGDETRQDIRQRAAAKFVATKGATAANVDDVCARLLGPFFERNVRTIGADINTPPNPTHWVLDPGVPDYSLGGGTWYSIRSKLAVSVAGPSDPNDAQWAQLVRVELPNELDRGLPAWVTFSASVGVGTTGFLLDFSRLDFSGLT